MADFKVGDIVRFDSTEDMKIDYLDGHEGTVVKANNGFGDVGIQWNEPLPLYDLFEAAKSPEPVTWTQYLSTKYLSVVEPAIDQDTVNTIVKYLRDTLGYPGFAAEVEEAFAVPQTRTVTVNFQVPAGESVVDYLENVEIDYDIEGGN